VWRLKPIPGVEKLDRRFFSDRLAELGKPTRSEKLMLAIFVSTAALWIFRRPLVFGGHVLLPGWETWPKQLLLQHGVEPDVVKGWFHDSIVAIGMAALAFFLPGERGPDGRRRQLLDWETAQRLPWGILLLIGGGFALANAFQSTDLARQLGDLFADLVSGWPTWLLVVAVCLLMTFLTEITSNVATVSAVLPVLAGLAVSDKIQIDPRLIMIPATISASCAFMLPIATPPNAIVFGSGKVTMGQMARKGLLLNLIGVVLISLATYFLFVPRFGISLDSRPTWAEEHQSEEPGNTTTSKTKNQDLSVTPQKRNE
jgi:sodium-dependent dicarboxylate transporter 2/3/5